MSILNTKVKLIDEIDEKQDCIWITPSREEVESNTVRRKYYGLHGDGSNKKRPLDLEHHV